MVHPAHTLFSPNSANRQIQHPLLIGPKKFLLRDRQGILQVFATRTELGGTL
jgi:hypothetical protein